MSPIATRPPSQLLGPEHDAVEPTATTTTYLICTTPRSGSNLLCDRLTATGVLGTPTEYLEMNLAVAYLTNRWRVDNLLDYLETLKAKRTGSNGVFANKVHWRQVTALSDLIWPGTDGPSIESCAAVLDLLFPNSYLVHLRREDRLAQAVSLFKAFGTGAWSSYFEQRRDLPDYDFASILSHYRALVWEEVSWEAFFQAAGVTPLRLTYRMVVDDPTGSVQSIADHIGIDADIDELPAPTLERQRTSWNDEIRDRFIADLMTEGADPTDPHSIVTLPVGR